MNILKLIIMKSNWLTVVVLLFLGMTAFSQEFDKGKLNSYFDALRDHDKFMGSVAVSRNGEVIFSRSVGFADVEKGQPADADSRYRIGSISKTFTAVMVMKAVEAGKLTLEETISKYFPGIPNAEKITVSDLLYHRSGIHCFTDDPGYLSWCTQPKTWKELEEIIVSGGSDFEPGSKMAYSNSNYVLLSIMLEEINNKPYDKLLRKQITRPARLKSTYYGRKADPTKNECYSYTYDEGWKAEAETDMSVPLGAGAIVSTPADLVKFIEALFSGKLVSSQSLERMTILKDNFGLGLIRLPFHERFAYGHTGGIDGFQSIVSWFPDDKVAYAIISNGCNTNMNNISIAVLSAVFGKPYEIPDFKVLEVDPETLDQYAGVYSSEQLPVKITISRENNGLKAQGSGQPAFPLEAFAKDQFRFDQAGIVMEFQPAEKKMILKQGGGTFTFTRE